MLKTRKLKVKSIDDNDNDNDKNNNNTNNHNNNDKNQNKNRIKTLKQNKKCLSEISSHLLKREKRSEIHLLLDRENYLL